MSSRHSSSARVADFAGPIRHAGPFLAHTFSAHLVILFGCRFLGSGSGSESGCCYFVSTNLLLVHSRLILLTVQILPPFTTSWTTFDSPNLAFSSAPRTSTSSTNASSTNNSQGQIDSHVPTARNSRYARRLSITIKQADY